MKALWMLVGGLAVTACGSEPASDEGGAGLPPVVTAKAGEADARPAATALTIACAPPGEAAFRDACAVDRTNDDRGAVLTIRLPDGGFRRLRVSDDGREVAAADGSEAAVVVRRADAVEIELGGARFRLPARMTADAPG